MLMLLWYWDWKSNICLKCIEIDSRSISSCHTFRRSPCKSMGSFLWVLWSTRPVLCHIILSHASCLQWCALVLSFLLRIPRYLCNQSHTVKITAPKVPIFTLKFPELIPERRTRRNGRSHICRISTVVSSAALREPTFVETVQVQLSDEGMDIIVIEGWPAGCE